MTRGTIAMCLASGLEFGRGAVEPVNVGQQDQQIGARHGGDAGGETIIVAIADFGRRDRVVLVDHRHGAQRQKPRQAFARVEVAAALLRVAERHQHLPGDEAAIVQRLCPETRQGDLADRGGRLAVFELQCAARKAEHAPSQRHGAGRHDQHVGAGAMQIGDVVGEALQPGAFRRRLVGVDDE